MKNNFKKTLLGKVISLFAVAAMVMALVPGALVSAATYSIAGDAGLYAPPFGRRSAVTYKLLKDGVETPAVLTISPADGASAIPAGVSVYNNKVLLDGTTIQVGSFNVTLTDASDPSGAISKKVTVDNLRIFWDFNDVAEGTSVKNGEGSQFPLTKLDGTSWTHTGTGSSALWYYGKVTGGYMGNNTSSNSPYFHNLWGSTTTKVSPSQVTIDTDLLVGTGDADGRYKDSGNAWSFAWTKEGKLRWFTDATDLDITLGKWNNISLTLNYADHTVIPAVNGVKSANTYNLTETTSNTSKSYKALRVVQSYVPTDNVAVYSGEPVYDALTVDGVYTDNCIIGAGAHTAKARIDVQLATGETKQLILAHFLADGTLNKAKVAKAATAGTASLTAELEDISGGYVKVFLWDGGLVPLDAEIPAYFSK